jgi:N-acetylglucosamine kinase-like BadF-type ATPase
LSSHHLILCLEGGGTRSQALLMTDDEQVLKLVESSAVNTNFVPFNQAQEAVLMAVNSVLQQADVSGKDIKYFVSSLVGPRFGIETFGALCPNAEYLFFCERDLIFARAGLYRPHGVAVVAATGATAWGLRQDNSLEVALGGWGSLLGDEGSAFALGLLGLRGAVRVFEARDVTPTRMVEAVCQHFKIQYETFHQEMIQLAYQKPLSRTEIAGFAVAVTNLAQKGDVLAQRLSAKVANDLSNLAIHAARRLFTSQESFDLVIAGGLVNAGDLMLAPLKQALQNEFPDANFHIGNETPGVALGKLAIHNKELKC